MVLENLNCSKMKVADRVLNFASLVGVLTAGGAANSHAQQTPAYPPYQPTPNEIRAQSSKPIGEDRVGRLERRVSALEEHMAEVYKSSGTNPETISQPPTPPVKPDQTSDPHSGKGQTAQASGSGQTHLIQEGETLQTIARKYGIALDELVAINKLDPYGPIYVGDKLWIPEAVSAKEPTHTLPTGGTKAPTGTWTASYKVQPGDTLFSISRRAGVSPNEIAQQNRLSNSKILVGQVLVLPGGQPPSAPVTRTDAAPQPVASTNTPTADTFHYYDVVQGDTLSGIAKIFYTTEPELRRINKLTGNELQAGQRIVVPTRAYFEKLHRQQKSPLS